MAKLLSDITHETAQQFPQKELLPGVVSKGRKIGIFYKWSHCYANFRGYKDAKFKGLTHCKARDRYDDVMSNLALDVN